MQKFKETGDSRYIYQNKLDKACFQYDMAYGDFKDLPKKELLIKYFATEHLILQKAQNMRFIKVFFIQWFINFW